MAKGKKEKEDKQKSPKEASSLFHNIMKASVKQIHKMKIALSTGELATISKGLHKMTQAIKPAETSSEEVFAYTLNTDKNTYVVFKKKEGKWIEDVYEPGYLEPDLVKEIQQKIDSVSL